jgi:hypothetical protein
MLVKHYLIFISPNIFFWLTKERFPQANIISAKSSSGWQPGQAPANQFSESESRVSTAGQGSAAARACQCRGLSHGDTLHECITGLAERGLQSAGPQGAGGALKPGHSSKAGICNKYAIICQKYAHEFRKYVNMICKEYAQNMH